MSDFIKEAGRLLGIYSNSLLHGHEFLKMQAEGLALAVGGKQALLDLLRQGKPVLAAHGPYTAAGESSCESALNLASSAGCSAPIMTCYWETWLISRKVMHTGR